MPGTSLRLTVSIRQPYTTDALVQVDTEGAVAQDDFIVTYHGEPLNPSMVLLVNNTLQYTLQLSEVEREESY